MFMFRVRRWLESLKNMIHWASSHEELVGYKDERTDHMDQTSVGTWMVSVKIIFFEKCSSIVVKVDLILKPCLKAEIQTNVALKYMMNIL